ncbi:MAG: hypothetical protein JXB88_10715 [Spirochaetales bacterium]|nr:hypothetical protein [Spirochaetales bacterium]
MAKAPLHEFHFIISEGMKNRLKNLDLFKESWSLSGIIVKILSFLVPVIKREHKQGKQRKNKYSYVSPALDERREHVHAYLPVDVYRHFTLIHHDLSFFSIAQIVRVFLELFLLLEDRFKDDTLQELENMYKQWRQKDHLNRLTLRQHLRQLYIIIKCFPKGKRLLNLYDGYYSPILILQL